MIDYSASGGVAIVRLDAPPLNVLDLKLLDALVHAIDRAECDKAVRGIVIASTSDSFTAGADINLFRNIATGSEAASLSKRFQDAFNRIEACVKPVAAAVTGPLMGGGTELALAAHFRVISDTTRISMPEITLGILPGAGGTQRLTRVIGVEAALDMLLSGKPVNAAKALEMGLVNAVCEKKDTVSMAIELVESGVRPVVSGERTDRTADAAVNESALLRGRKKAAAMRPEIIAAGAILDAVETGVKHSFNEGLGSERTGFSRCMEGRAARNRIHLFFAGRETARIVSPDCAEAFKIDSTAVIGMGSMGTGIAQAFAAAGKKVTVFDTDAKTAQAGLDRIAESFERKIGRGASTREDADAVLGRIGAAKELKELADADLIIEAVFEDVQIKSALLAKISENCKPQTVIASNTSTIDLDLLAKSVTNPSRFVGLHFFNPAHSMPLVEVIRRNDTDGRVIASAMKLAAQMHKTPVLVNNRVGFVVNRIFIPYMVEAFALLEEGAQPEEIDAAMVDFGFAMGPLTLIDMTGIDILLFTDRQMQEAFPSHLPLSLIASALVEKRMLGQKSGCGIYRYDKGDRTTKKSDLTQEIVERVRRESKSVLRSFNREEITSRLVMRLVAEAMRVAQEGIAMRESDIDVATVLGIGFPDFRGGVMRYARDEGARTVYERLRTLSDACGKRYEPGTYLQSII